MSKKKLPETYSVPEFAKLVNRSRQSVQAAIVNGYIPGCTRTPGPGRQPWRVPASALAIYGITLN